MASSRPAQTKVRVKVDASFGPWGKNLERAAELALLEVLPLMVQSAQQRETPRQFGGIQDSIHILPIEKTHGHISSGIAASDWKANFYEKGTAAHSNVAGSKGTHSLTAKGRKRRKAAGLVTGVKGLHYLRNAVYAGRPVLLERMKAHMGRASTGMH